MRPIEPIESLKKLGKKKKIGLAYSGGIDSTYTAAVLLKETDHDIHLHKCHIVNQEGRVQKELEAVQALIPKLQTIRPFTFDESSFDQRQFVRVSSDVAVSCFAMGGCQSNLSYIHDPRPIIKRREEPNVPPIPHLDLWTIGTHKAEGHDQERWKIIRRAVDAGAHPVKAPKFFLLPLVSKREEMRYLDELGLLEDCWFCRTPTPHGNECGRCRTCKEVEQAVKQEIIHNGSKRK